MIVTSGEADTMWCLLAFEQEGVTCTTIRCMAWRWYDPLVDPLTGKPDAKSRRGYCGLAGKPEHEE